MKIIQLEAENIKRLKAVSISPDGNLVEITGRNGQGKSSVLDAIWWALSGTANIQSKPIRKGEDEARIRLDLGGIKVTRTFKAREDGGFTTNVVIESEEGARFPSPQNMLNSLIGSLSFDPLAFTRMQPNDQLEALKRFVPDVDFAAIEKANKDDFDKRTDVNRTARALRSQASAIEIPSNTPKERVRTAALVEAMERAGEHNTDIERRRARREDTARELRGLEERIRIAETRAAELRAQADRLDQDIIGLKDEAAPIREKIEKAEPLPEPIDTAILRQQIAEAETVNAAVVKREEKARVEARAKEFEEKSAALTKAMEARETEKREAIARAELPVPGISFGDDEILLNGVPFDQASSAEQLRTSVAIAMAANPKLRVIRVQDGSLLDEEAMRILAEMAVEADCQVWIECVQSGRSTAVVIEDGQVLGAAIVAQAAE
ncbi:ATP-binding protein [Methylobacterium gnaphalii]|uniref:Rad50/SbcC-type AAA domain-containing protein n=1 Tax=Methylobacterium gnaphalii TaxID=1010610 RepID=A0A512JIU3_9HYPH|nr:ATP-binding protein [Methylobacterium gnaphalii]GEP09871.1 hypothetical protein MGN01_17160 [Methylobacterium gnaphalii]GJD67213.1 DNA replication and repair protein RecF [Methylobacterium gnaphalii]GLS49900.1 hypothetical protein GCM10007885_27520 [Methylobacterium gnaphalii]